MSEGVLGSSTKRLQKSRLLILKIIMTWFCTTVSFLGMLISTVASAAPDMGNLNEWIVFLVLPLNSMLNPVLYTYFTPQFLASLKASSSWILVRNCFD